MPPRKKRRQEDKKPKGAPNLDDFLDLGGGGASKDVLGVPEGYTPPVPQDGREYRWRKGFLEVKINGKWRVQSGAAKGTPHRVLELYRKGDEFQLAPRSRDETLALQERLANAGLLDPDDMLAEAGQWGTKTRAAFKSLLTESNVVGRPWSETLTERQATFDELGISPGGGEEPPPFVFEPTNPADLGADLSDVAEGGEPYTGIGRGASDAEKLGFAAEYNQQEFGAQRAAYDAERAFERGELSSADQVTVNAPPESRVAAEEHLKRTNPGEYQATAQARQAAAFEELLLNSRWRLSSG